MFELDQEVKIKDRLFIGPFTLSSGEKGRIFKTYNNITAYDVFFDRFKRTFFLHEKTIEEL